MDLNYLYQRYAISLDMSKNAACDSARSAHRELADAYQAQIEAAKINGSVAAA